MGRNDLKIRPFEAHSHFQSIANPPRPQIPQENSPNPHFPKNQKIRKSGNPPGSAAMGGAPLILQFKTSCSSFSDAALQIRFIPPAYNRKNMFRADEAAGVHIITVIQQNNLKTRRLHSGTPRKCNHKSPSGGMQQATGNPVLGFPNHSGLSSKMEPYGSK